MRRLAKKEKPRTGGDDMTIRAIAALAAMLAASQTLADDASRYPPGLFENSPLYDPAHPRPRRPPPPRRPPLPRPPESPPEPIAPEAPPPPDASAPAPPLGPRQGLDCRHIRLQLLHDQEALRLAHAQCDDGPVYYARPTYAGCIYAEVHRPYPYGLTVEQAQAVCSPLNFKPLHFDQ